MITLICEMGAIVVKTESSNGKKNYLCVNEEKFLREIFDDVVFMMINLGPFEWWKTE